MESLEILFITLPVIALLAAVAVFFSVKKEQEYTINVTLHESEDQFDVPVAPEPVAKPKRRYKRRKKKVTASPVSSPVTPPVAEVTPAVKKAVGRPRKTN